jgi:hypothetical protein
VRRVFVVGYPRSGTTLVHGTLAASKNVLTFRETHYFSRLFEGNLIKRWWRGRRRHLEIIIYSIFLQHDARELYVAEAKRWPSEPVRRFVKAVDRLTESRGRMMWVEKTPRHLHFVDRLEQRVPGSDFVHVLRNPLDAVLSLYRATNRHPRLWGGRVSIPDAVERWKDDCNLTMRYHGKPNHYIVLYDRLVTHPRDNIAQLCAFLGITYEQNMLRPQDSYHRVVEPWEDWKVNNSRSIGVVRRRPDHDDILDKWTKYIQDETGNEWSEISA